MRLAGLLQGEGGAESGGGPGAVPHTGTPFRNWTVFITPRDFTGDAGRAQRRAIRSWTLLRPRPRIVLMVRPLTRCAPAAAPTPMQGSGVGYGEICREFQCTVDPRIDLNLVGMPLAGSLLATAEAAPTDVSIIINSDILLSQSFVEALAKASAHFQDFFMTGARFDLEDLPPHLEPSHSTWNTAHFDSYVREYGVLHTAGGADYFAWNNRLGADRTPLILGHMPPFIRGKSKFDNWFVHEVVQGGFREAIDGTGYVVAAHVKHGYDGAGPAAAGGGGLSKDAVSRGSSGTFWQKDKASNWQIYHNLALSVAYGTYSNQAGTPLQTPWRLQTCIQPDGAEAVCMQRRKRPAGLRRMGM